MAFFEEQNKKIVDGTWTDQGETHEMHLDTLGIINGCVDTLLQEPSYPEFAYNNTYGIQAINQSVYEAALDAYSKPGGVKDLIETCRSLASESDPTNQGHNATVNDACALANAATGDVENPYFDSGRGYYDIAAVDLDPFPRNFYIGYLNQPHVQRALGAPVNYSNPGGDSPYYAFQNTGDYPRGGFLEDIAYLLENGVKVAMAYGDRDYACNWIGGETVSLAVNYTNSEAFRSAGYTNITVNDTYVGGLVRQHGNFSFSRVFQAGHEIPAYQPETAYKIFMRALFNHDIATGTETLTDDYSTKGLANSWSVKDVPPESEQSFCYTYALSSTCTDEQIEAVEAGTAVIQNYILIDNYTSQLFPEIAAQANMSSSGGAENSTGTGSGGTGGSSSGSGNDNAAVSLGPSHLLLLVAGAFAAGSL
jgi:hypothetical protein